MNQPDASAGEPRAGRNSRLSAEDWAQAALDLIAEQGVGAVAVEPLARRLGVTKGSFYWHFPSRDALLQAALERWELFEQEQVFGSLEDVPDRACACASCSRWWRTKCSRTSSTANC